MTRRPYRSRARAEAAEETHRRILAAAGAVLRAKGAAGFSLESVGREAGVTRLTVYNQFGSRRALLEAVFDERAEAGGLFGIPDAMADPDPRAALRRLIAIFCGFWSSDPAVGSLQAAGAGDAEFETGLAERNERRRGALGVLADRLGLSGAAQRDAVDLLFVLTSYRTFAELAPGRSPEAVAALLQAAAEDVVRRAAPEPATSSRTPR